VQWFEGIPRPFVLAIFAALPCSVVRAASFLPPALVAIAVESRVSERGSALDMHARGRPSRLQRRNTLGVVMPLVLRHTGLTRLSFEGCQLHLPDASALANQLQALRQLQDLSFTGCGFTEAGVGFLALGRLTALTALSLSGNAPAECHWLVRMPQLARLHWIMDTQLDIIEHPIKVDILSVLRKLTCLELSLQSSADADAWAAGGQWAGHPPTGLRRLVLWLGKWYKPSMPPWSAPPWPPCWVTSLSALEELHLASLLPWKVVRPAMQSASPAWFPLRPLATLSHVTCLKAPGTVTAKMLSSTTALRELAAFGEPDLDLVAAANAGVIECLSRSTSLTSVSLKFMNLSTASGALSVARLTQLSALELHTPVVSAQLWEAVCRLTGLKALELHSPGWVHGEVICTLPDVARVSLLSALRRLTHLVLDIRCSSEGVQQASLGNAVATLPRLLSLNMSAAAGLGEAAPSGACWASQLQELHLTAPCGPTHIVAQAASDLLQVLACLPSLTCLALRGRCVPDAFQISTCHAILSLTSLQVLTADFWMTADTALHWVALPSCMPRLVSVTLPSTPCVLGSNLEQGVQVMTDLYGAIIEFGTV
jgi:hypothetical protein